MINPFSNKDKELQEFKEAEQIVKAHLQELQRIANDLLLDNRYKAFSRLVDDAEKNTIDLLLRYREDDPYKFKAKVDEFLTELRVYRNILNSAKDLTNPKPKQTPNFSQKFKGEMQEILNKIK